MLSRFTAATSSSIVRRMSTSVKTPWTPASYPTVRREDTVETFQSAKRGKIEVPTPYQYLETPPSQSKETAKFVEDQATLARSYLDQYPDSAKFERALSANWNYPRFSCPSLKGDGYFYHVANTGLQQQSAIYRFKGPLNPVQETDSIGELFFDPNLLSEDGSVSRSSSSFSEDGKWFAYQISRSGSDWNTIYVRSSDSPHSSSQKVGADEGRLDDALTFVKFSSIGWTKDSLGFFYQRYPAVGSGAKEGETETDVGTETDSAVNAAIYYHRVGSSQADDVLVIPADPTHPEYMFGVSATEDGRYLVMTTSKDTARSNLVMIADLNESEIGDKMKWIPVVPEFGDYYGEMANDGSTFYFYTNRDDSPNYKVSKFDVARPELGFTDLISHDPNALLSSVHIADHSKLILLYSVDVKDSLYLHDLETGKRVQQIGANLIGSIDSIAGRRKDSFMTFSMTGFTSPGTIYNVDFSKSVEPEVYRTTKVAGINPDDFVSEQVFFQSKDGTRIPMFLTSLKDVKRDGTAPVIQYGYGGFSHSMDPFFSPSLLTWIKHYRGVLAVVNLRGGGEYGESWHLAGIKEKKQNVFDDFQYATKYIIDQKIGAKDKISISGGSNGGLLVAACLNQAPELYAAGIADVGVMDMLRFDRFTIGAAWRSDYGTSTIPEEFDYLFDYSPLENVPAPSSTPFPPTMLLTGSHDDRVSPLHSFKLIAELQHRLPNNPHPLLLRVDNKAGHGAGKSTQAKIKEAVEKYGFVAQSIGLQWHD